jgi:hypothetical protein
MDDEDGGHLGELLTTLADASAWAARTGSAAGHVDPAPGSAKRGDDPRAHPYELSHAAWHSLGHAVDHLCCLRALLGDAKVVPMYAPFSLVRAVLENACSAVWMLQPHARTERLARRLRFAITDIRNGEEVKELTGQPGPRPQQERIDEIRAIAARAGIGEASVSRGPGYKEIVQAAGGGSGPAADVIYLSWKLCSGMAHGDFWPTWSAMARVELPGAPEGTGTFRIEANIKLLMYVTALAVKMTGRGFDLYDQRCHPPF